MFFCALAFSGRTFACNDLYSIYSVFASLACGLFTCNYYGAITGRKGDALPLGSCTMSCIMENPAERRRLGLSETGGWFRGPYRRTIRKPHAYFAFWSVTIRMSRPQPLAPVPPRSGPRAAPPRHLPDRHDPGNRRDPIPPRPSRRSDGAVSQQQLDRAIAAANSTAAQLRAARKGVVATEAQAGHAASQIDAARAAARSPRRRSRRRS